MNDEIRATYLTDYRADTDSLDFTDFQDALHHILTQAQTPLTVGVFGTWGSGKTTLMHMLRKQIDAAGLNSTRTVWFTAWKYDQQDTLWRALILRVLDALYPRETQPADRPREERPLLKNPGETEQKLIELLKQLENSVYQPVSWDEVGGRSVDWWQFIGNLGKAGAETAAAIPTGGASLLLKKLLGGDDTPVEEIQKAAQAISREVATHHRRQLLYVEQFEETFRKAIDLIRDKDRPGRLIVFVDDLDRCLPEKAIEVLEAIKLFLEVPGTVFVLGTDQRVIQQGIEARYGAMFRQQPGEKSELPIHGSSYLQKIVQIPFHLPALSVDRLDESIREQDKHLPEMTRLVFAHGCFPNPRQVKRALNIFRLLQQIALKRENGGKLEKNSIAWPLLAKTVLIQTQYPELYQLWRQFPTLVQELEEKYDRRQRQVESQPAQRGKSEDPARIVLEQKEAETTTETEPEEDLLAPYLRTRHEYPLLQKMMTFPPEKEAGAERTLARFAGLKLRQLEAYIHLAGAVGAAEETAAPVEVATDLLDELLSSDDARIREAAARLEAEETEHEGQLASARQQMVQTLQNPGLPAQRRASAGSALARLGDPRFRADAWYLPDEPLLGFVEIPAGPFLMGSDKKRDQQAEDREIPQHTLELPTYYMARYPVTVAQFRAFVEGSGHQPGDKDSLRGLDNHPVVNVTWHETMKYCAWLTEQLRKWPETPGPLRGLLRGDNGKAWQVILPSEAEWEKAARGTDGLVYPWPGEFDTDRANTKETGLGGTSAVGCFPGGASPYGCLDMSGSVWEWTRSLWGEKYPYKPEDGRENTKASDNVARILRGGSCYNDANYARCAFRSGDFPFDPLSRLGSRGWRVALSPFFASGL